MKGPTRNNSCTSGGDMLAYLYDEMAVFDRDRFESHLADCSVCIDDLAELSQGRYPVYEWRKLEFEALETPRIVIPADAVGLIDRVRSVFAFRPAFRIAGAFAGLVAVTLIGYAAYIGSVDPAGLAVSSPPVDADIYVAEIPELLPPAVPSAPVEDLEVETQPVRRERKPDASGPAGSTVRKASRTPIEPRAVQARTSKSTDRNQPRQTIPVLSTRIEEDDSLRLADLFDDIGTIE